MKCPVCDCEVEEYEGECPDCGSDLDLNEETKDEANEVEEEGGATTS